MNPPLRFVWTIPFTPDATIKKFLRHKLTEHETLILKFGLKQPIEPKTLIKTDILSTFESPIELFMTRRKV